jgi:hypothetical protein
MYEFLYEQARAIDRRHRHISAIVYKNKVIIGKNELNSGRCGKHSNFSVHSEVSCMTKFLKEAMKPKYGKKVKIDLENAYNYFKLPKVTLINVRVLSNGSVAESKPCNDCMSLIKKYPICELQYHDGQKIVVKKLIF